jgi:Leucine-rich repeat (LRR) protein
MKNLLLVLLLLPTLGFGQNVNIPDANFKAYLVGYSAINTNGDTEIQVSEASAFNGEIYCVGLNISNLTGIEAFTALTGLSCGDNQLTSLDLSKNTALTGLSCSRNQLTSLNISKNTASNLNHLLCDDNQLTSLNLSGASYLLKLKCHQNQLTSLDLSKNTALTWLDCFGNQLTSLDLSKNTALTDLGCYDNKFDCDALKSKYGLD